MQRVYNETVAEYLGLDYEHVAFDPVILEDRDGIPHTFQFPTRVFSDRLSLEALETGQDEGYEFSVIADAEQDLFVTFRGLFERIRRELGRKHIEPEGDGYQITDAGVVCGQITSDPDALDRMPLLVIDGKPVTWEELGRMVSPYEGFNFKLQIFDRSEEREHDPPRSSHGLPDRKEPQSSNCRAPSSPSPLTAPREAFARCGSRP